MRILFTGFVVFVIWCFISVWLYNAYLLPVIKSPVPVQSIPEIKTDPADSLLKLKESMPKELLIYFEFDKYKFKADSQTDNSIADFKAWLDKSPESKLTVTGHTDWVGTDEYNMALGLRRARSVEQYLESLGISINRMITTSEGESKPAADNLTDDGRAKNRRTEVLIKM
jgi:outer membrane protein OmpA-like peptidoglycan-associated protein